MYDFYNVYFCLSIFFRSDIILRLLACMIITGKVGNVRSSTTQCRRDDYGDTIIVIHCSYWQRILTSQTRATIYLWFDINVFLQCKMNRTSDMDIQTVNKCSPRRFQKHENVGSTNNLLILLFNQIDNNF